MPTTKIRMGRCAALLLLHQENWKPGDLPPPNHDYVGWHEWAEVQGRAGLKQKECGKCGKWRFPQELTDLKIESVVYRDKRMTKPVKCSAPVCAECVAAKPGIGRQPPC